ncbi:MAG: hypothetical protein WBG73_20095 [Coleofasciculaceae cyanobacterium]
MISAKITQSLSLLLISVCTAMPQLALAQTLAPSEKPLETELLNPDSSYKGRDIVTANTISTTGLSVPSLWWAKEQFNEVGGKLINNWIAYQDEKRIDLIVNRQPWTLLDYLGKYRFTNKFGTVARNNSYNVRIFNLQGDLLATYTCNYTQSPATCQIKILDPFGRTSLPVIRPSLGGE